MGLVNKLATKFHQHGKCENPAFSPSFCRLWLETSCRQCCTSGGSVPICACATYKSTLGTFSSAVLKCLRSWRNLISTPLETQTQSFFSCPHPHSILPYARVRAVNISTLWWLQDFCSQATGQAARGETWPLPASDLSVASLFLISAGRHYLLFQYFINNDCLSKQQCNYRGMDISCESDQCAARCGCVRLDGPRRHCSSLRHFLDLCCLSVRRLPLLLPPVLRLTGLKSARFSCSHWLPL